MSVWQKEIGFALLLFLVALISGSLTGHILLFMFLLTLGL
jgi:two-component system, OmpR family, phosphate regulon sensor histidine kinase PhoR